MGRPWKRIAIDFVAGLASLLVARMLRQSLHRDGDDVRLQPGWVLAGVASSIGWGYASDADVFGVRSRRSRGYALSTCWGILSHRYLPEDDSTTYSVAVGTGLGTLCYRFWFGIVRPNRAG